MTLDLARSVTVEPGSNPRGEQADTNWLFLLPSLALPEVLVIGTLPYGTLVTLGAISQRLTVAAASAEMRRQLLRLSAERGVETTASPGVPDVGATAPRLVCVGADALSRISADGQALGWLRPMLEGGCSVYLAPPERGGEQDAAATAARLGIGTGVSIRVPDAMPAVAVAPAPSAWLIPGMHAPSRHRALSLRRVLRAAVVRYGRSILTSRGSSHPGSDDAERVSERDRALGVASIASLPDRVPAGTGLLLRPAAEMRIGSLPRYLLDVAEEAGLPLSDGNWRLAPPRGYRSQKVIFFVRTQNGEDVIVKITQDPRFNHLLENEAYALEELERVPGEDGPIAPSVRFRARHAGLAVVAEDAIPGRPFVSAGPEPAGAEQALAVTSTLTALAVRTAKPATDVREALTEIIEAYDRIYDPRTRQLRALKDCAASLGDLGTELPVVFMHGDATVYNVLMADGSRAGLVDWENAEPAGLPLWDVFHFLQTRAAWSAERAGRRYVKRQFHGQFVRRQPGSLEARAIDSHVRALHLPEDALEPLLLTWLARHAVREARQLRPSRLSRGFYQRLLVHALKRRRDGR